MCDRIGIIHRGALIANAPTRDLLARMDVKSLVITPDAPLAAPPDAPPSISASLRPDGALVFTYRRSETRAEDVLDLARAAGVTIRDVASEEADLEDVFVSLTRASA